MLWKLPANREGAEVLKLNAGPALYDVLQEPSLGHKQDPCAYKQTETAEIMPHLTLMDEMTLQGG